MSNALFFVFMLYGPPAFPFKFIVVYPEPYEIPSNAHLGAPLKSKLPFTSKLILEPVLMPLSETVPTTLKERHDTDASINNRLALLTPEIVGVPEASRLSKFIITSLVEDGVKPETAQVLPFQVTQLKEFVQIFFKPLPPALVKEYVPIDWAFDSLKLNNVQLKIIIFNKIVLTLYIDL